MSKFVINRPQGFEAAVRTIVKQSFPFAAGSTLALQMTERELRGETAMVSTRVPGSGKERFVWGVSRMGSSRVAG
jgi:hypothetical protein